MFSALIGSGSRCDRRGELGLERHLALKSSRRRPHSRCVMKNKLLAPLYPEIFFVWKPPLVYQKSNNSTRGRTLEQATVNRRRPTLTNP